MKMKLKRNDDVVVLTGDFKGKTGKILQVLRDKSRVIVEGVALAKKHIKKSQQHPDGAIMEVERPIHCSNVMLKTRYDAKHGINA